jgi:acyl carrier protein
VSGEFRTILIQIISDDLEVDTEKITDEVTLADLDLDSIAMAELIVRVKEETGIDLGLEETSMGGFTVPALTDIMTAARDGEPTA